MAYALLKALLSGVIVALVSEVAKRNPGAGGLIASLPLVSVLGMIWLWKDTGDAARLATHSTATFWFVLPSLPMFLLIPALLTLQSLWIVARGLQTAGDLARAASLFSAPISRC